MVILHGRIDNINFLKKLLIGAPQRVGVRRAWDIYNDIKRGGFDYIDKLYGSSTFSCGIPTFDSFDQFKGFHRTAVAIIQREEEAAKRPRRRKAQVENEGYSEVVVEPQLANVRYSPEHKRNSLVEDKWKADRYGQLCMAVNPVVDNLTDSFENVYHRALIHLIRNRERSILTNEVIDFSNPYMLKMRATSNLLHEGGCVRTKLEESLVDELLDSHSGDLLKLRSDGPVELPGEILEPLNAFAGITFWSNDPQIRIMQKLDSIRNFLEEVGLMDNDSMRSEKNLYSQANSGFESTVPNGRTGGWGFGKPRSKTKAELNRTRYPTLQRVAHTLSSDPQFNEQVQHAVNVLERSKGWTFDDKKKAVNTMKEVLDNLPSSKSLSQRMDRTLPIQTMTAKIKGGLIRYRPSNLRRRNRIRMYFRSITATMPLSKRWTERRAKNAARAKKDKKK